MSDFLASDLIAAADARFGQTALRSRVAPGASPTVKDLELKKIAQSVIGAVQAAAEANVGWPLPGTWPPGSISPLDGVTDVSGVPFRQVWPYNLIQKALEILNYRTYSGLEVVSPEQTKIGAAAEQFLVNVAKGSMGLGLGVDSDTSPPGPEAARDRQGNNLLQDGAASNLTRVSDTLNGPAWDFF